MPVVPAEPSPAGRTAPRHLSRHLGPVLDRLLARPKRWAQWPVHSQQVARRNALVAATALAEQRRELLEVEEFLARHAATHAAGPVTLQVAVRPA